MLPGEVVEAMEKYGDRCAQRGGVSLINMATDPGTSREWGALADAILVFAASVREGALREAAGLCDFANFANRNMTRPEHLGARRIAKWLAEEIRALDAPEEPSGGATVGCAHPGCHTSISGPGPLPWFCEVHRAAR